MASHGSPSHRTNCALPRADPEHLESLAHQSSMGRASATSNCSTSHARLTIPFKSASSDKMLINYYSEGVQGDCGAPNRGTNEVRRPWHRYRRGAEDSPTARQG